MYNYSCIENPQDLNIISVIKMLRERFCKEMQPTCFLNTNQVTVQHNVLIVDDYTLNFISNLQSKCPSRELCTENKTGLLCTWEIQGEALNT